MATFAANSKWHLAAVLMVCAASVLMLATRLHYGFLPHDDPGFSYLAERTYHGELPNVDFYDDYTGGLSYLNALALHVFGLRLISLRIMLLLFFIPWVPAAWYLASRVASPINAMAATLLAAAWSVPVYPTPYGTWYNLYFATFGAVALYRYVDTRQRRWLFWAGVCGGLSFLAKILGIYFIAAAGLFLIFDEQESSASSQESSVRWSAFSILVTAGLFGFVAALAKLTAAAAGSLGTHVARSYHFVLPAAAVCIFLVYREWTASRARAHRRLTGLSWRLGPFCIGVAVPVLVFLIPYLRRHAVGQWLSTILGARIRVQHWANAPSHTGLAILCIPLLLVLLFNSECKDRRTRTVTTAVLAFALSPLLLKARSSALLSGLIWYSVADFLPIVIVVAVILLLRKNLGETSFQKRLMLLTSVTALLSLGQFPYAAPVYFCFAFPFLVLTLVAVAEQTTATTYQPWPLLPVLVFYLLFAVVAIFPGELDLDHFGTWPKATFSLPVAAGFTGDRDTVELYQRAVPEIVRHAGNAPIYAGPDSPGFYFLTGRPNPTPIYFEFLAGSDADPQNILKAIDRSGVRTVIINHAGSSLGASPFNPSGPQPPELANGLRERFPQAIVLDYLEIRWKP